MDKVDLPKHLAKCGVDFKPHHLYKSKKKNNKTGKWEVSYSFTKDFFTEFLRENEILCIPKLDAAIPLGDGKMGLVVSVEIRKKNNEGTAHGMASVTGMKYEKTEESHAQLAMTRAIKKAVTLMIGLSDRDAALVAAYIGEEQISEEEEPIDEPEDIKPKAIDPEEQKRRNEELARMLF